MHSMRRMPHPNEKFSGAGHARHLCKDCSKLGDSELKYRQARRNLESLITWEGIIGRKKRKAFNRFREHPDPRIRQYAGELAALDAKTRAMLRFEGEEEFFDPEEDLFEMEGAVAGESLQDLSNQNGISEVDDEDIPF